MVDGRDETNVLIYVHTLDTDAALMHVVYMYCLHAYMNVRRLKVNAYIFLLLEGPPAKRHWAAQKPARLVESDPAQLQLSGNRLQKGELPLCSDL